MFKVVLEHIGYNDVEVTDMLVTGVRLIGELESTDFWPPNPTGAL